MSRNLLASAIGVAAIAIAAFIFNPSPSNEAAAGPKLTGQMQNFVLTERLRERPDLYWSDGDGNKVRLADFAGKVVLFNYWASWCAPCQRELPGMDRIQAKMAGENFTVVALNIDRGGKPVALRNAKRLALKHLSLNLDPEQRTTRTIGLRAMPTTYLFDRQGRLLGLMEGGAEWDTPEAIALINYFIDHPTHAESLKPARS